MLFIESLTYGQTDYLPIDRCGLIADWQVTGKNEVINDFDHMKITITNSSNSDWTGIVRIGVNNTAEGEPFFMLPGFMVGTNRGDAPLMTESKTPRLRKHPTRFPASPWWMVRGDRLSHPVAMVYRQGHVCGICGDMMLSRNEENQYAGFGCDIDRNCVYYSLGWENAPWFFVQSHNYTERVINKNQCITIAAGESLSVCIHVFDRSAEDVRGIHSVIRDVYALYHQAPRPGASPQEAVKLLAEAVDHDAWMENRQAYAGFVFDRGDHMEYRPLPSITWTNGLSAVMPVLLASHILKDDVMHQHAVTFIQNIVDHSMNEAAGIPWTVEDEGVWSNRGWWFDCLPVPGHTGYLVGQALYSILQAYEAEKQHRSCEHPDWLRFVERSIQKLITTCNNDGEFPYVLSEETGTGLCYDSFSGAWCLAAAAYYTAIAGDKSLLPCLLDSEMYYYRHYVAKVCCYGGPLDIDKQVDSEGVLAYMRAVRRLHTITGEEYLLSHMKDAFEYEFTFKFCYNVPVTVPPLSRGWSSCGGSITSVSNPHIHPMSSTVVDEMLYYLSQHEDPYIRSRMEDTLAWGFQTFSRFDKEYDYGKAGWMSERFCYSQGLLTERYPDGSPASTWFALMPWAAGCILEGFCGDWWDARRSSYP